LKRKAINAEGFSDGNNNGIEMRMIKFAIRSSEVEVERVRG
jgi:hypothetical protein